MSELKEFIIDEDGGVCPECKKHCHTNDGASIAANEGSFYDCPYCGKVSVLIYNGARFIAFGKVWIIPPEADVSLEAGGSIPCIEESLLSPNPLWKPNKTHYTYYPRRFIVSYMSAAYREDL